MQPQAAAAVHLMLDTIAVTLTHLGITQAALAALGQPQRFLCLVISVNHQVVPSTSQVVAVVAVQVIKAMVAPADWAVAVQAAQHPQLLERMLALILGVAVEGHQVIHLPVQAAMVDQVSQY
jgi:hypothetical protein